MTKYKLSLAIPHYNEEKNVKNTIPGIFNAFSKEGIQIEIVAVDNGSRDGTLIKLKELQKKHDGLKIISLKENRGFGGGIIEGLRRCSSGIIGFTCADDQIKPSSILELYKFCRKNNMDLAKAKRIKRHDGLVRYVYSKVFNFISSKMFDIDTGDVNGYPVMFRKSLFDKMGLKKKNWMINIEMLLKSRILNARRGELEMVFYRRTKGRGSVNIRTPVEFLLQTIGFVLEFYFSRKSLYIKSYSSARGKYEGGYFLRGSGNSSKGRD